MAEALRRQLSAVFGIDPRGLAALRIGLGCTLLVDLWMRAQMFRALYTDAGVFPLSFLDASMRQTIVPLHLLSGSFAWQASLFALALLFALLLVVGRFTRIASVASWALVVSIQARNPVILNLGDELLRMALFWAMFLPLDRRFALDARGRPPATDAPVCSVATAAFLLQIGFVYFFTALLKTGDAWRVTGLALYYALHMDAWVTPLGVWLRQYVGLTRVLSFATFGLEAVGPFLLLAPIWWVRTLTVLAFLGLHLGIAASTMLGLFPWIDAVVLLPFLPSRAWDALGRVLAWRGRATAAATAGPGGGQPAAQDAAARALVSDTGSRAKAALLLVLLAYVFLYNVNGVRPLGLPTWLTTAGRYLRVNQQWLMFTPEPPRTDGWWVIPGTLAGGRVVDLSMHGPELTWEKPASSSADYDSFRWFVFFWQMNERGRNPILRHRWINWRCGEWNRSHPSTERLEKVEMIYLFEETPDYPREARLEKRSMGVQACPESGAPDASAARR